MKGVVFNLPADRVARGFGRRTISLVIEQPRCVHRSDDHCVAELAIS